MTMHGPLYLKRHVSKLARATILTTTPSSLPPLPPMLLFITLKCLPTPFCPHRLARHELPLHIFNTIPTPRPMTVDRNFL